ncbi:hypothetical protein [Amycolatopsis thailandensis]|uniref:hypothetical protein n=1 Tax=Amycolatopsis thailandensis TaxID=589330 RepID=UPI00362FE6E6
MPTEAEQDLVLSGWPGSVVKGTITVPPATAGAVTPEPRPVNHFGNGQVRPTTDVGSGAERTETSCSRMEAFLSHRAVLEAHVVEPGAEASRKPSTLVAPEHILCGLEGVRVMLRPSSGETTEAGVSAGLVAVAGQQRPLVPTA